MVALSDIVTPVRSPSMAGTARAAETRLTTSRSECIGSTNRDRDGKFESVEDVDDALQYGHSCSRYWVTLESGPVLDGGARVAPTRVDDGCGRHTAAGGAVERATL